MERTIPKINRGNRQEATTNRADKQVDPERKWIRLMELGLSLILAVPGAVCAGYLLKGPILIAIMPLVLGMTGYCCLGIGHDERVKLKNQRDNTE